MKATRLRVLCPLGDGSYEETDGALFCHPHGQTLFAHTVTPRQAEGIEKAGGDKAKGYAESGVQTRLEISDGRGVLLCQPLEELITTLEAE